MKKTLICASLGLMVLSGCKKDDSDNNSSNAISASLDGTAVTFNVNAKAMRTNVSGAYSVQIIGYDGNSNQIAIAISSDAPITTGTYSENSSDSKGASVNYIPSGSAYPYISYNSTSNPATVTISSISATSIQATFQGDVYLASSGGITNTKKAFTNGQFNVKF